MEQIHQSPPEPTPATSLMPSADSPKISDPAPRSSPPRPAEEMQARISLWLEQREVLQEFIRDQFVDGKDFGRITVKGRQTKPTLFKAGSEKLLSMMGWMPRFKRDRETHEMLGSPTDTVCYKCLLVDDQGGQIQGEGRGSAKLGEGMIHSSNNQIKIALKRAQVDATLRALSLSEYFTQDLEDEPPDTSGQDEGRVYGRRQPDPPDEQWAQHRNERDVLTRQIGAMREKLSWSVERFGQFCLTDKDYGMPVAQMDIPMITRLRDRLLVAVQRTYPDWELPA